MTRVHVKRELPTSKSLSMNKNSRLFPAPTGTQVNIFSSVTGLPFYRGTSTLPGKNSLKNTQTKTKILKETTKNPHSNQKPQTFPGFYKPSVLPTPLTSVTCSAEHEILY